MHFDRTLNLQLVKEIHEKRTQISLVLPEGSFSIKGEPIRIVTKKLIMRLIAVKKAWSMLRT